MYHSKVQSTLTLKLQREMSVTGHTFYRPLIYGGASYAVENGEELKPSDKWPTTSISMEYTLPRLLADVAFLAA
jgi:hypothetical protein